jgi:hypothetical protein
VLLAAFFVGLLPEDGEKSDSPILVGDEASAIGAAEIMAVDSEAANDSKTPSTLGEDKTGSTVADILISPPAAIAEAISRSPSGIDRERKGQ